MTAERLKKLIDLGVNVKGPTILSKPVKYFNLSLPIETIHLSTDKIRVEAWPRQEGRTMALSHSLPKCPNKISFSIDHNKNSTCIQKESVIPSLRGFLNKGAVALLTHEVSQKERKLWDRQYQKLQRFQGSHGHLFFSDAVSEKRLAKWLEAQHKEHKQCSTGTPSLMSNERKLLLEKLGVVLEDSRPDLITSMSRIA